MGKHGAFRFISMASQYPMKQTLINIPIMIQTIQIACPVWPKRWPKNWCRPQYHVVVHHVDSHAAESSAKIQLDHFCIHRIRLVLLGVALAAGAPAVAAVAVADAVVAKCHFFRDDIRMV